MLDFLTFIGLAFIFFFLPIILIVFFAFIKKVPINTVIIIDRNTHFHKKKKHGYYFFNPKTDVITSKISSDIIVENYANTFETHDSVFYCVEFAVAYKSENVEATLSALEDSRRSIYDICNCAVDTFISSCSCADIVKSSLNEQSERIFSILESTLEPFYIDVVRAKMISIISTSSESAKRERFQKHVSSSEDILKYI